MEPAGAVEKAIEILFHLHSSPASAGVTAIGQALGIPKSSAHRLLGSLARRGLVERDAGGRYRPGMGLVALGLGALEREPVVAAARPLLETDARAFAETVFLVGARAGRLIVLDKAEGTGFLRAAPRVGSEVPVHATAVGKLFLALCPECVATPERLERFTPQTADREALDREVERARARGFAENREEWIPGLSVLAAPVRGEAGSGSATPSLHGAVALAATTARMNALGHEVVARHLMETGRRIAARLEGEHDA
jgi:DNA-binding IclR family transcriptional regulator